MLYPFSLPLEYVPERDKKEAHVLATIDLKFVSNRYPIPRGYGPASLASTTCGAAPPCLFKVDKSHHSGPGDRRPGRPRWMIPGLFLIPNRHGAALVGRRTCGGTGA